MALSTECSRNKICDLDMVLPAYIRASGMMWNGVQQVWFCTFDAINLRGTNEFACGARAFLLCIEMSSHSKETSGIADLSRILWGYLAEIERSRAICAEYEGTTAIHDVGQELQLYRVFESDEVTATHLRTASLEIEGWDKDPMWKGHRKAWEKLERDIEARVKGHSRQIPLVTRGITWEGRPVLIHAYKFETDPNLKIELVLPKYETPVEELPSQVIASAIRCHEFLAPRAIAKALSPYDRHEAKFLTISEYLTRTMPKDLYAAQCFPSAYIPVSRRGVLPPR